MSQTPLYDLMVESQDFDPATVDLRPWTFERQCEAAGITPMARTSV